MPWHHAPQRSAQKRDESHKHTARAAASHRRPLFRLAARLNSKVPADILKGYVQLWTSIFGPMETRVIDLEGGLTGDMASFFCDRYNATREFGGIAAHARTGLAERTISL
eukprot:8489820-Pyramimonas_sp.AAC.1